MWAQRMFYMNIEKYFTFKNKHHRCSCKVCHWSGVKALTWSPNTTKTWPPPALTFSPPPPSNHLRIAQLMCLWAKSMLVWHSFLYWLQMNELGHVNVGKEIIHQPNSGCLRRQVLIVLMKQVLIKEPRWWGNLITYLDWTPKFEWCVDEPIDEHMFWRIMCCACSNLLKNQHK